MLSNSENKENNKLEKKSFRQSFSNLFSFKKTASPPITQKTLLPKESKLLYQPFEDIVMPEGYNIFTFSNSSIKPNKNNGILLYDLDGTLFKYNETIISNNVEINNKTALLKEIKIAKDKGFLVGILTARTYTIDQFDRKILLSITNIIKNIDINFFNFIIFTNQHKKDLAMIALSHHYNFPRHQLCLVEDNIHQIKLCDRQKFKTVNVNHFSRHNYILDFLSFPHRPIFSRKEKYLPLLPSIAEKDSPPPLEAVSENKEEVIIQILNSIEKPIKACFIFTLDWVDIPLNYHLLDFLNLAFSNKIALILITKAQFNKQNLKHFLSFSPHIAKSFYAVGYTNEDTSYQDLLYYITTIISLPPENIILVGNAEDVMTYGNLFGFKKLTLSVAYVQMLHCFAQSYVEKEPSRGPAHIK